MPNPVAARSEKWIYVSRSMGIRVRIPPGAWMSLSCENCVCCQVEVSATG